jgi:hypothetical protein
MVPNGTLQMTISVGFLAERWSTPGAEFYIAGLLPLDVPLWLLPDLSLRYPGQRVQEGPEAIHRGPVGHWSAFGSYGDSSMATPHLGVRDDEIQPFDEDSWTARKKARKTVNPATITKEVST